ncbi:MAG TPA: hypothetical protein VGE72_18575 [Azospirillum sp.]
MSAPGPDTPPAPGRGRSGLDRLFAVLLLGLVAFNPPLLRVFGAGDTVLGLPLLYVYIFAVWAVVILFTALHVERGG